MDFMTVITYILLGVITVYCIMNVANPRWFWKKFRSGNATKEPEEMYFRSKRLAGIIGLILIGVFAVIPTVIALFQA